MQLLASTHLFLQIKKVASTILKCSITSGSRVASFFLCQKNDKGKRLKILLYNSFMFPYLQVEETEEVKLFYVPSKKFRLKI